MLINRSLQTFHSLYAWGFNSSRGLEWRDVFTFAGQFIMREKRLIILFIHSFHDNLFLIAIVVVSFMGRGEKTLWPSSTVFIWISQQRDGVTLVEVKWCIGNKSRWANLVTSFSFRPAHRRHSTEVVRKEIKRRLEKRLNVNFYCGNKVDEAYAQTFAPAASKRLVRTREARLIMLA